VDPGDRTLHSNSIKSMWCQAKSHIKRMRGVSRAFLSTYLDEFIWRNNAARQVSHAEFGDKIIDEIAVQYPPFDPVLAQVQDLDLTRLAITNDDPNDQFDVAGFGRVKIQLPDYATDATEHFDVDMFLDKSFF
jgi:hypothetical protein